MKTETQAITLPDATAISFVRRSGFRWNPWVGSRVQVNPETFATPSQYSSTVPKNHRA
jgi:hypothetical protein